MMCSLYRSPRAGAGNLTHPGRERHRDVACRIFAHRRTASYRRCPFCLWRNMLPLRLDSRKRVSNPIKRKVRAHSRPDDWLGPSSKPCSRRSWAVKKITESSDLFEDDTEETIDASRKYSSSF
jgi:hypothetical protein